jgi:hypothetical protein
MNIGAIAGGGSMLGQAVSLVQGQTALSTQMSMLKMSAEAEQSVANMLAASGGQAAMPSQAVTPAAAPGKGTVVDMIV